MKPKQVFRNFFLFLGQKVHSLFPKIERQLRTAQMDEAPEEYLADALVRSFKLSVPIAASIFWISMNLQREMMKTLSPLFGVIVFFMSFLTFASIPNIRTKKRTRKLEKDLPYALRDILIQIESGIPLYQAMQSATSGYGEMSEELKRILRDIDGGKSMTKALEESIVRNPSERYRRSLWQLTNAIKSGTDITRTMNSIVDSIIKEQKIEIEKYGEELNPYILVYLLVAVIGPALGITGIIVISSFTGTSIGTRLYIGILFGLVVVQIFFLNLIKSQRPEVRS